MGGGKKLLFNVLNSVAIPSILFAAIEYIPKSILRGDGISVDEFLWETVGGRTYWFTSALVIAQLLLLLLLISRYRKIWLYWIVSLVIFAYGMYMVRHDINFLCLPYDLWQFKHGLYAIAFLTAGGLYWKYENMINKLMQKWIVVTMVVTYFVIFSFWSENLRVLVSLLDVNWSGYFAGCFASVLLIELCKYLPRIKILTYIGQNTIAFYFMSGALPIVISMVMNKFGFDHTWYGLIIVWIVSISFAYIITHILNRYVLWVFDFRRIVDKGKE